MAKRRPPPDGDGGEKAAVAEVGSGAPDAPDQVESGAGQEALREELESELEEARKSASEHWDNLLRARAELDNLRKRSAREVENAHKYGLESLMNELLPVRDSMHLGLSAADGDDADVAKLREGLELTLKLFDAAVEKFGLTELDPQGESFDPRFHQAMSVQDSTEAGSGIVVVVVQKGYLLNDRVLRPAMVIVAK
jgi:molecular chaperone GrpE